MSRQGLGSDCQSSRRRSKIDGGVVILHRLGDRDPHLLPVLRSRDPLAFHGIAEKASLKQNSRNFDVPQDMEARMANAAIEDGDAGENGGMDSRGQRHILRIQFVPLILLIVGVRQVTFLGSIGNNPGRRERVTFHAGASAAGVEVDADEDRVMKTVREIDAIFERKPTSDERVISTR